MTLKNALLIARNPVHQDYNDLFIAEAKLREAKNGRDRFGREIRSLRNYRSARDSWVDYYQTEERTPPSSLFRFMDPMVRDQTVF